MYVPDLIEIDLKIKDLRKGEFGIERFEDWRTMESERIGEDRRGYLIS